MESRCQTDPRFLSVVSFYKLFGKDVGLPPLDIARLVRALSDPLPAANDALLKEIHLAVLRRRARVVPDSWKCACRRAVTTARAGTWRC